MKKKIEHTPTPWKFDELTKTIRAVPSNYWLATMDSFDGAVDNKANAKLIIRAVNAHEELVGTLKDLLEYHNDDIDDGYKYQRRAAAQRARQVIARLEGKL